MIFQKQNQFKNILMFESFLEIADINTVWKFFKYNYSLVYFFDQVLRMKTKKSWKLQTQTFL